jgi:hypothetical protein
MPSSSAARVKLKCRATASKARRAASGGSDMDKHPLCLDIEL